MTAILSCISVISPDTLPPVISDCPSDIILPLGMTVANWIEPTATDNSGNLPIIIKSHEPGTNFAEGNTTVSYTFFDDAGNQANCTFVVVVTFGRFGLLFLEPVNQNLTFIFAV